MKQGREGMYEEGRERIYKEREGRDEWRLEKERIDV
jgi:hypothetical protein